MNQIDPKNEQHPQGHESDPALEVSASSGEASSGQSEPGQSVRQSSLESAEHQTLDETRSSTVEAKRRGWLKPVAALLALLIVAGLGVAAARWYGQGRYDAATDQADKVWGDRLGALDAERDSQLAAAEVARRDVNSQLIATKGQLVATKGQLDAVAADNAALRERYDPEIKAELNAEVDAEVNRACGEAKTDLAKPIDQIVKYDQRWSPVIDSAGLVARVDGCAAPERQKSAAQREQERLAACAVVSPETLEKDPSSAKGRCVVMFARIVQFDSNTGPCHFHAMIAAAQVATYEYKTRSDFSYRDTPGLGSLDTDCPGLTGIDNNDIIKVWATGTGSLSYSTTLGGTNTVPSFRIEKVSLVAKG